MKPSGNVINALSLIERQKIELCVDRQKSVEKFVTTASAGTSRGLSGLGRKLEGTNEFIHVLDEIVASLTQSDEEGPDRWRYLISSLFLYDCFKKLTADREEQFFFVTGTEIGGTRILDQPAEFEHQKRTETGVTGDIRSTHKALIRLEQFGHRLLATFHSHPTNGPSSTRPSKIDENFQRRLESAGHSAIMAIFSRDGFIRFFRLDVKPTIEIYGKGVELHDADNTIYRLTDPY